MDYLKRNWDKAGILVIGLVVITAIIAMIISISKKSDVDSLISGVNVKANISAVLPRAEYEKLIEDIVEPGFTEALHRRNIFSQEKGVQISSISDLKEFKTIGDRFKVMKIYKKPVKLLFKGYIQLPGGPYVATINWAGKTDFKKIGEEIRGYKVVDFKKSTEEKTTFWGGTEEEDKSVISLERGTGERFNLEIGKITLEKEIYAEIYDYKEKKLYEAYIGFSFLDNKVLDITPKEVIIETQNGEKVNLK